MLNFFLYATMTVFIIVCLFMILIVLIQKGRGGGLASAFGGAGGNTAFGSKTGDVLTWATSIVFGVFLLLAVALNIFAEKRAQPRQRETLSTGSSLPQPVPADPGIPTSQPQP